MRFATSAVLACLFSLCAANADASVLRGAAENDHGRAAAKLQPREHYSLEHLERILSREIQSVSVADLFVSESSIIDQGTMLVLGAKRSNKVGQRSRRTRKRKRRRKKSKEDDDDGGDDDDDDDD